MAGREADAINRRALVTVTGAALVAPAAGALDRPGQTQRNEVAALVARAENAALVVEGTRSLITVAFANTTPVGTVAQMAATEVPAVFETLLVSGYGQTGDGGRATYRRVRLEPDHEAKFRSADGAWWELDEQELVPAMFGGLTEPGEATATLRRAFTHAFLTGKPLVVAGDVTINGPIAPGPVSGGALNLRVASEWTVNVSANAPIFEQIIGFEATEVSSFSITGARMILNGNGRAGCGLHLRHRAATDGGTVIIDAPVRASGFSGDRGTTINAGILIAGRFERVVIRSPEINDISRRNPDGFTQGITVWQFVGDVEIHSPVIRRIRSGAGSTDADGIKCFGLQATADPARRRGRVRIYDPVFEDCQGRSYKDQCGDTVILNPRIKRDSSVLVANEQSVEFDFQFGGGIVQNAYADYVDAGGASPFHASDSHSFVVFQQVVNDADMYGAIRQTTVVSSAPFSRFALFKTGRAALSSTTEIDGLVLIASRDSRRSMISRAVMEFDGGSVAGKATETSLSVRNVRGPLTCPVLGYTGYSAGDLSDRLIWCVRDCSTSLPVDGASTRAFNNISGEAITSFKSFELGDNPGFRNFYSGWEFDIRTLRAGTRLVLDLGAARIANGPPWGRVGIGYLECKALGFFSTPGSDTVCEARRDNATGSPSAWFTQNGGATWGAVG